MYKRMARRVRIENLHDSSRRLEFLSFVVRLNVRREGEKR